MTNKEKMIRDIEIIRKTLIDFSNNIISSVEEMCDEIGDEISEILDIIENEEE